MQNILTMHIAHRAGDLIEYENNTSLAHVSWFTLASIGDDLRQSATIGVLHLNDENGATHEASYISIDTNIYKLESRTNEPQTLFTYDIMLGCFNLENTFTSFKAICFSSPVRLLISICFNTTRSPFCTFLYKTAVPKEP